MTSPIDYGRLYHTGIVVDDIEATKAEFSELMGVSWGFEGENEMPVWLPDGARTVTFRYAYTVDGPHKLELVAPIPGTLWTVAGRGHAHHFGYWCDDVSSATAELVRRGIPVTAKLGVTEADQDGPIALFQTNSGVYIELVSSEMKALMFGDES